MVIASGFLEVNELNDVERVLGELKLRGVRIEGVNEEKVVFLIEKETITDAKIEIDSLNGIEGIRNVYLTYYSMEGAEEEK
ncbi:MAG: hypothetical protein AAB075_00575 [Gemmatimonadota bacterium]